MLYLKYLKNISLKKFVLFQTVKKKDILFTDQPKTNWSK